VITTPQHWHETVSVCKTVRQYIEFPLKDVDQFLPGVIVAESMILRYWFKLVEELWVRGCRRWLRNDAAQSIWCLIIWSRIVCVCFVEKILSNGVQVIEHDVSC
jgi:hypothetical protein